MRNRDRIDRNWQLWNKFGRPFAIAYEVLRWPISALPIAFFTMWGFSVSAQKRQRAKAYVEELAAQFGIKKPAVIVFPFSEIQAVAISTPGNSFVAISTGLLNGEPRLIRAALRHELAHHSEHLSGVMSPVGTPILATMLMVAAGGPLAAVVGMLAGMSFGVQLAAALLAIYGIMPATFIATRAALTYPMRAIEYRVDHLSIKSERDRNDLIDFFQWVQSRDSKPHRNSYSFLGKLVASHPHPLDRIAELEARRPREVISTPPTTPPIDNANVPRRTTESGSSDLCL